MRKKAGARANRHKETMMNRRLLFSGTAVAALFASLISWQFQAEARRDERPRFEVDAQWPKPLPNN
ncbi:MAG: hypothetical protein ABIQ60_14470, partial [Burkholderiaceae bacterium]